MPLATAGGFLLLVNLTDERFYVMGLGPTVTLGYQDENGNFIAVSEENPLPTEGGAGGSGSTDVSLLAKEATLQTLLATEQGGIRAIRRDADTTPASDGEAAPLYTNQFGRLKVSAQPAAIIATTGNITGIGQTVVADVARASNVMIQATGTFAGVNLSFETSIDGGATWFSTQAVRTNANTIEAVSGVIASNPAYAWELSVNACTNVRVRSTAWTSGTAVIRILPGSYATEPIPAAQATATQPVSGTVTATVSNGTVIATPAAGTGHIAELGNSTNALMVKNTTTAVFEVTIFNPSAAPVYFKMFNKASTPTVGTDVPAITIPVPAASSVNLEFGAIGKRFATGFGYAFTLNPVKTDTTIIPAGVQISATYI